MFSAFNNTLKPSWWSKPVYELDLKNEGNNGYKNEDLMVWIRTAVTDEFTKPYRRVNHSHTGYKNGLPRGLYQIIIEYSKCR